MVLVADSCPVQLEVAGCASAAAAGGRRVDSGGFLSNPVGGSGFLFLLFFSATTYSSATSIRKNGRLKSSEVFQHFVPSFCLEYLF
jgi:hypothetical protein